jgi:hypothetical protein
MIKVELELEVRMDFEAVYYHKVIYMDFAPTPKLIIDDDDITLELNGTIIYAPRRKRYFCRLSVTEGQDSNDPWDPLLVARGWRKI